MAARWSSENVVVEFRDSQVSRGPSGAFWACALPAPPPRCRLRLGGGGATLQPGLGRWVTRSCQTRAGEGSRHDRWGRLGGTEWVSWFPAGVWGVGSVLGPRKRRDRARVSAGGWGARGSAPRGRGTRGLMTSGEAHNFSEPQLRGLNFASLDSGVGSIKRSTELSF